MGTLHDLLILGEQAAESGEPLVPNWVQVRAALCLIDHAMGLRAIGLVAPASKLPEEFEDFGDEVRRAFPSRKVYKIARREIFRLLAVMGHVEDPWEALRVLIRRAGREDLERVLWPLVSAAHRAGRAPSDILRDWVWSLDAECRINGIRKLFRAASGSSEMLRGASFGTLRKVVEAKRLRQRAIVDRHVLRHAVVAFDKLREIDEIAASGLLPPEPIGAPPTYDRLGRARMPLPPQLSRVHAASRQPTNLPEIWQAICASHAADLPDDPSADDLLAPETWSRITALHASVLGVAETTWKIYLGRTRAALQRHATAVPDEFYTDELPPCLAMMASRKQEEWALKALWRRIEASNLAAEGEWSAHTLLDIEVWRALWGSGADDLKGSSLRQYETTARKLLLRHAPGAQDPLRHVRRCWSELPAAVKADLAPIRKHAERALLRPREVTPDWLKHIGLRDTDLALVGAALDDLDRRLAMASAGAAADPVVESWRALRAAARGQGFDTSRLAALVEPAVRDRRRPSTVDQAWASRVSATLGSRVNARFKAMLRTFDAMRENPALAPLLSAQPIGEVPDRRRKGNLDLPDEIAAELETVGVAAGHAENTRRENRSLVRELVTRAAAEDFPAPTLTDLLRHAARLGVSARKLRKAEKLLATGIGLQSRGSTL